MSLPNSRHLLAIIALATLWCLTPSRLTADLVWNPDSGWSIEGGALAGLAGVEGRTALDLMNRARRMEERGDGSGALKAYRRVARTYNNSIYAPEALHRSGQIYLARRQYHKAFDAFQQILGRYPNTKRFNEIIGEQYRIASTLLDGGRSRTWAWFPGMTSRTRGIEYFEFVLYNAPFSDYAPLALMNIARGHQLLKNQEEAIYALDRMINTYPQSLLAPDAYLKLAETHASLVQGPYYDQASTREAITYFQDFMILFPNDPNIGNSEIGLQDMRTMLAESKIKMADFYFYRRDNFTAARLFYNEAITTYPDSAVAQLARQRLVAVESKATAAKPAEPGDTDTPVELQKKKRFFFF